MRVHLDYGSDGLDVDVPDDRTEVVPPRTSRRWPTRRGARRGPGRPDRPPAARRPLRAGHRVAISVCDITRAQPRALMLEALFAADAGGAPPRT